MSADGNSSGSPAEFDHEEEFERAWKDPRYTAIAMPPIDVNENIRKYFHTSKPLTFTRTMMWDNEVRKGWRPDIYIPSAIQPGSVRNWGGTHSADGLETFERTSVQRQWTMPQDYGRVVERVRAYHKKHKILFIGTAQLVDDSGTVIRADTKQPLFHIEHWVEGEEDKPVAKWRIVHLTETPSDLIHQSLEQQPNFWATPGFPEFIPIYISHVLNINLERR